jgi:tetratricopeptide (TPR) repeat protein
MNATSQRLDHAWEALRLAEADPGQAVALGAQIAREARAERDLAAATVAERALGLAALHLENLDAAVRHLRSAVTLGRRASDPALAAEARMTLAFALSSRGRPQQALHEIETALGDLRGVAQARAQVQRGSIQLQLGRLDEALGSYRAALPALRRDGDLQWVWRALLNRGVVHTYRYEFRAAEADLLEAEALSGRLNLDLSIRFVQQNLGFLNAVRGDVPMALRYLDLAEESTRALGSQLGGMLTDRSELLLSAGLVAEAREAATQAVRALERERRQIILPEVRLLLARAMVLDGDPDAALHEARRAVSEFVRQDRPRWVALARLAVLTCRVAGGHPSKVSIGQAERVANGLAAAGWPAAVMEARLLAARLALSRDRMPQGCEQLRLASRGRRRGPAALRARAWYAEALLRLATGNRRGARIAVAAGLRVLDEHRATLGATDLRAYASLHRIELAELGLRAAFLDGRPKRVLACAEQGRASHLLLRPARPPDDPRLARMLAGLRITVADINRERAAGSNVTKLLQRQVVLERKIRDYSRQRRGDGARGPADPVPFDNLGDTLGESALVEFIQHDGALHAITVVDRSVRLWHLGPLEAVRDLVDQILFALQRLAHHRTSQASRAAATALLRHAADQQDAMLLRPLDNAIADRPIVLIPTGFLQSLPWSVLPSCAGKPVTVSPSAALWHAARGHSTAVTGHVTVAAGPHLPGAQTEAEAVAAIYGTTALVGAEATSAAVTAALDGAAVVHLAAHGKVRVDNPLFSSLLLEDGPLTIYDLERLQQAPATVVLAACDSARSVIRAGDELLGLSVTFLSQGTRQLIGSVIPVPDAETAPLMVAFHRLLAAGQPAATALARSQRQIGSGDTRMMAAAAGFICIGAGLDAPYLQRGAPPG